MGRRSNPPGSRIARAFLLKFGFCRELPSPLQQTYQHSAVDGERRPSTKLTPAVPEMETAVLAT